MDSRESKTHCTEQTRPQQNNPSRQTYCPFSLSPVFYSFPLCLYHVFSPSTSPLVLCVSLSHLTYSPHSSFFFLLLLPRVSHWVFCDFYVINDDDDIIILLLLALTHFIVVEGLPTTVSLLPTFPALSSSPTTLSLCLLSLLFPPLFYSFSAPSPPSSNASTTPRTHKKH